MVEINEEIIEHLPKNVRVQRGNEYYENDSVTLLQVDYQDEKNYRLSARVAGSYWNHYLTMVTVVENEIVSHYCECPDYAKGNLCKHVIATIYQAVEGANMDTKCRMAQHIQDYINSVYSPVEELTLIEKEYDKNRFKMWEYNRTYSEMNQLIGVLDSIKNDSSDERLDVNAIYENVKQNLKAKPYTVIENGTVRLEPKLTIDTFQNAISVEFKIGVHKMYLLKNYEEFYEAYHTGAVLNLGKEFTTEITREKFTPESLVYLDFILAFGKTMQYANQNGRSNMSGKILNTKAVLLANHEADEFLNLLTGKEIELTNRKSKVMVRNQPIAIRFYFEEGLSHYLRVSPLTEFTMLATNQYLYFSDSGEINRIPLAGNQDLYRLLKTFQGENSILIAEDKYEDLQRLLYKKFKKYMYVPEEDSSVTNDELGVKVLLDLNEADEYTAMVRFCYGEIEFNPMAENVDLKNRNIALEKETLETFFKDGFQIENQNLVLKEEDDMYEFLQNRIERYMKHYEVLATERFSKRTVRKPTLSSVGIKINQDLLDVDISQFDVDWDELKQVFHSYQLKKKYYKLKDGSFLDLQNNRDLNLLEDIVMNLDVDLKKLKKGMVQVPMSRSLYLQNILQKNQNVKVEKDQQFTEIVENMTNLHLTENIPFPDNMKGLLRDYQKTGYQWLKVIEHYQFGGILADDMGLRKNNTSHCTYRILFISTFCQRKKTFDCGIAKFFGGQLGSGSA